MPTEAEIEAILSKADKLENEYFQKRAKAIIALIKIFGKRRAELGMLEPKDLTIEGEFLYVFFTICKKSKKGFFQYLKFLKKQGDPALLDKPLPILEAECKDWNLTKEGSRLKTYRRQKVTPLSDKFAKLIVNYYEYMKAQYYDSETEQWKIKFLFPSGKESFGADYYVSTDKAISGRQLLAIYKDLDSERWLHLYRKLKGVTSS
jgi:integrase